jgi:dTDP-glucose 4,6-dehydratase
MNVLLTGGCGLVGANLLRRLLADDPDREVFVIDLSPPDELMRQFLGADFERATFIQADVSEAGALADGLAAIDPAPLRAVFHAAILDNVPEWEHADPRRYIDVNVGGTANLLEWARSLPALVAFVYVGSGSVYGEPGPGTGAAPQHEDGPIDPPELYAITKYFAEHVSRRYGELFGLAVRRVRLSGVYGPMERPTAGRRLLSPVHAVARSAATGAPLRITARTLDSVGDHVSAEDVADGLVRLLATRRPAHPVYNLADGHLTTFRELLAIFAGAGRAATVEVVDDAADADLDLDPANRLARWNAYDITRARADLAWAPRPLAEQVSSYLAWLDGDDVRRCLWG